VQLPRVDHNLKIGGIQRGRSFKMSTLVPINEGAGTTSDNRGSRSGIRSARARATLFLTCHGSRMNLEKK
jgi:hypothetical protein